MNTFQFIIFLIASLFEALFATSKLTKSPLSFSLEEERISIELPESFGFTFSLEKSQKPRLGNYLFCIYRNGENEAFYTEYHGCKALVFSRIKLAMIQAREDKSLVMSKLLE